MQSNYETAQAIASEPIYDTIIYDTIDEEGQENIEMSPLNTATVSKSGLLKVPLKVSQI